MRVVISNKLYVEDATSECLKWCQDNLVLQNPEYYKKEKMGKWTGNTPKTISLYEKMGEDVWIPFGCYAEFFKAFPNTQYKAVFQPLRRFKYQSNINLYDYQEKAVQAVLKGKNGVLVAMCGSGKTQMGLEIIARIGGRALWLTHTQDLLNQSMERAKSVFDAPLNSYGTITAGKINVGSGITFATVQTLSNIDLTPYKDYWDVVVVDECAHAAGSPTKVTQFYKVLSNLAARYKIGLTATPKRADGLERSMFALLGDKIIEIDQDEIANKTCEVRVMTLSTGYTPDYNAVLMSDGTLDYLSLVDDMIKDEKRFDFVQNVVNSVDGPTIVLGNRVEYLRRLNEACERRSVCLSAMGQSKVAKAERKMALENLNNGELDVLFCTYQLAAEGLDVPKLRYVIFSTPEKDPSRIQQSAGRVARKAEGKKYGTVVDLVDDFGMYKSWYSKRLGVYKKLNYDIM